MSEFDVRMAALDAKLAECRRLLRECDELFDAREALLRKVRHDYGSLAFARDFACEVTPE